MPSHIAIRREEYVAGSRERPEVGVFTQTHSARPPVPWNRIAIGETVWMKWSGGPIVARARVEGFRQIEKCTPVKLRETTRGFKLHELEEYWATRHPSFYGMTIYLQDEEWLDELILSGARSRGESWIVLADATREREWLTSVPSLPDDKSKRRSRTIPVRLRFQVLRRDGFTCQYCGRAAPHVKLHLDHVVPWSKGGRHELENLRTACQGCNLGKTDRLLDAETP